MSNMFISAPTFDLDVSAQVLAFALALADDEFVMAHRHSEWLGLSPFLEEDLVMASIAQDELGHARGLYGLLWPGWVDRDALLVRRPAEDWRSCELVELGGLAWEEAFIRHLIYDVCEPHRWRALQAMWPTPEVLGLSERVLAEERFHHRHAIDLLRRLSRGGLSARARLRAATDQLWPNVPELLSGLDLSEGSAVRHDLRNVFLENELLTDAVELLGAKVRTQRSVGFADVQQMLVDVIAFDPAAKW